MPLQMSALDCGGCHARWQTAQAAQKDMRKAQKAAEAAKRGVKGHVPATAAEAGAQLRELRTAAEAGLEVRPLHFNSRLPQAPESGGGGWEPGAEWALSKDFRSIHWSCS